MKFNKMIYVTLAAVSLLAYGCKKSYLDTVPSDSVTDENLYTSTTGCYMVLNGMNRLMSTTGASLSMAGATNRHNDFGSKAVDLSDDIMGNDVVCNANDYDWFADLYNYSGPARANYAVTAIPWYFYYKIVNAANLLLANVDGAQGTQAEKDDIKGQAYAYRAWGYYRLSIYYCKTYSLGTSNPGVPVYLTPTTDKNKGGNPRGTVGDVYKVITSDLDQATTLLQNAPSHSDDKSYISLATAQGIYAEVALVMQNWAKADEMSGLAISNAGGAAALMDSTAYTQGFISAANSEWMWASHLTAQQTDDYGIICFLSFVDASNPGSYAGGGAAWRKITKQLFDKIANSDVRKVTFATDRKQHKFYMANTSQWVYDNLYMRIAEMFLIKAEAEANLGDDGGAISTLETLVKKRNAGYSFASTPYTGGTNLLEEIYLQRRIELFLEGHSLSDIVRLKQPLARPSGSGNHSIGTALVLTLPANSNRFLFKIPQAELDASAAIGPSDQNPD